MRSGNARAHIGKSIRAVLGKNEMKREGET
jgi:hypothetical protein